MDGIPGDILIQPQKSKRIASIAFHLLNRESAKPVQIQRKRKLALSSDGSNCIVEEHVRQDILLG